MAARDPYNAVVTWVDEPAPPRDGLLAGRTLLVKDLIDTAGLRTTYGSRIYADHVPVTRAPVVERLVAAGRWWSGRPTSTSSHGASWARTPGTESSATRHTPDGRRAGRAPATPPRSPPAWSTWGWDRHGLLDPAAVGVLRDRGAQAKLWTDPDRGHASARAVA
jgi:hypothetical protein